MARRVWVLSTRNSIPLPQQMPANSVAAPQPPEYKPTQEGTSISCSGCALDTLSKSSGASAGPAYPAIAQVASRKHTLPPGPLLAGGPMTHSQPGLAGQRCLRSDSTERQRVVTRTGAYHEEDARAGVRPGQSLEPSLEPSPVQHTAGPTIGRSGHRPMGWSLRSQSGAPGSPFIHS